jgi:tetratricopeptide (TPR) repeat protein
MKRRERHHLKENELVESLAAGRAFLEAKRRQLQFASAGLIVLAVAVAAVVAVRRQAESRGAQLLGEALVALNARVVPAGAGTAGEENLPAAAQIGATGTFPTEAAKLTVAIPKLRAAADAYPDSHAGIQARYHLAGGLAALGRHEEAIREFDDVARRAGPGSLYGRMARMGKADAQARAGQLDAAIAAWKDLASAAGDDLPVDAILIELGRAYLKKGDAAEARKTFTQIVDQHPESAYAPEAREELETLQG